MNRLFIGFLIGLFVGSAVAFALMAAKMQREVKESRELGRGEGQYLACEQFFAEYYIKSKDKKGEGYVKREDGKIQK
jgi:hypothetical protein